MSQSVHVSIVILTYQRLQLLMQLLSYLRSLYFSPLEIIVVDNDSDEDIASAVTAKFPEVKVIRLQENVGTVGRNIGIAAARGDIIVTIDDDIFGLTDQNLVAIVNAFADPQLGAACFKVLNDEDGRVSDWCHHYPVETHADQEFITNEITEGAVAFRQATLAITGLYPETFFISHEGRDLACRILDHGFTIRYIPSVVVRHHHSRRGRTNWRRYYYDTRNTLWLAVRNYPFAYGLYYVLIGLGPMLVYALRDGFFYFWLKGVVDSLRGVRSALYTRKCLQPKTMALIRDIERHRPSFLALARKRLLQREVRI